MVPLLHLCRHGTRHHHVHLRDCGLDSRRVDREFTPLQSARREAIQLRLLIPECRF